MEAVAVSGGQVVALQEDMPGLVQAACQ